MTDAELRNIEARYQRAFARLEAAQRARKEAIRAALADGWTHAEVAKVLGVSRGRINQLVNH